MVAENTAARGANGPLVSVVIATYDRPAYLHNAIASVLGGDYSNVEIIVADDCGNSGNREIAAQFADPRVVYHRNSVNVGIAINHIEAFRKLVTGELITILNDDDEWEPPFLASLVPLMVENPEVILAFSDHHVMDERGRVDPDATARNTRRWRRDALAAGIHQPFWRCLLDMTIPVAQASVIRRDAIDWQDFPPEVGSGWDLWLGYLACRTGKACYYLPQRLTRYRVHHGSATATGRDNGSLGLIRLYSRLMEIPELEDARGEIRRKCAAAHLANALSLISGRQTREARAHLRAAIALQGVTPRAALALALASMPGTLGILMLRTLRRTRRMRSGILGGGSEPEVNQA